MTGFSSRWAWTSGCGRSQTVNFQTCEWDSEKKREKKYQHQQAKQAKTNKTKKNPRKERGQAVDGDRASSRSASVLQDDENRRRCSVVTANCSLRCILNTEVCEERLRRGVFSSLLSGTFFPNEVDPASRDRRS